jgi:hypothetical protein
MTSMPHSPSSYFVEAVAWLPHNQDEGSLQLNSLRALCLSLGASMETTAESAELNVYRITGDPDILTRFVSALALRGATIVRAPAPQGQKTNTARAIFVHLGAPMEGNFEEV